MTPSKRYGSRVQLNHLKSGDITYYIVYKAGEDTVWEKVGRKSEGITERKAKMLRDKRVSEIRHNGADFSQQSYRYLTFDKLAELYFISNEAHNKSNGSSQLMYKKHIKPSFGDVVIAKLNDSLISELQALKRSDDLADSTNNQIVKLIKRIVGFGKSRGIITFSPFKNIKMFKIENTRLRYLSKHEVSRLYNLVEHDKTLELFVRIALCTGARAKSVLHIQKKDVNIENKSITLHDYKRANNYIGYLDAATFIMVIKHIDYFGINGHVVSHDGTAIKYQSVYNKLTDIFEEFNDGMSKQDRANRVVIHTLRHTFASHLAITGVSIQKIQKLMNHKDIKQTEKYAKLSPDSGREYVEDLYKG